MVTENEATEKPAGSGEVDEEDEPENTISLMRDCGEFLDVDLRCKDGSFGVQKLVLVMHSEYYRRLFLRLDAIGAKTGRPNANACVILEDVEPLDIVNIITYMYEGKVSVMQADIPGFISAAKQLRIEDILCNIPDVEMIQNRSLLNDTPFVGSEEGNRNHGQKRTLIDSLNLVKSKDGKRPKLQANDGASRNQHRTRNCSAKKPPSKTHVQSRDDGSWSSGRESASDHTTDAEDSDSNSSVVDAQTTRIYRPASGTWLVKDSHSHQFAAPVMSSLK
ncbi:unnamed protein product [Allacma fusca]|uniref:BTB domain-containing protein n=1 Tax=Allacma fusca TaxID=39272 RepID=A0A8J2LUA7_9HEXA|nr:unnamed protein product [Allacma fusca]